jgi:hypothetical protein
MHNAGLAVSQEFPIEDIFVECLRADQIDHWELDSVDVTVDPLKIMDVSLRSLVRSIEHNNGTWVPPW